MEKHIITAGVGEYEGSLFCIRKIRPGGKHQMVKMTPDGTTTVFPLNKEFFLSEANMVTPSPLLVRFLEYLRYSLEKDTLWVWMNATLVQVPTIDREWLARWAREGFVSWAETLPNPQASWLKPYDELGDMWKEADRIMGEHVFLKVLELFGSEKE